jgi:hypothetical protein
MITLITGMPGSGKTAAALSMVLEHEFYPDSVVISGVRDYRGGGLVFDDSLPSNMELPRTLYLIDECGLYWPSRTAGKPQPSIVSQLALHRHIGQDWILTAQHPLQVDVAIRRLIGRHIHILKTGLGFKQYECGECRDSLEFSRDETHSRPSLDKSVFDVYSSTDVITSLQKKGFKLPAKLKWMIGLIIVCVAIIGFSLWRLHGRGGVGSVSSLVSSGFHPPVSNSVLSVSPSGSGGGSSGNSALLAAAPNHQSLLPHEPDYPEIAQAPRYIAACLDSHSHGCVCYDSASQRMDVSDSKCMAVINNRNELRYMYPDQDKSSGSSSGSGSASSVPVPVVVRSDSAGSSSHVVSGSSSPVVSGSPSPPVVWETNVQNI